MDSAQNRETNQERRIENRVEDLHLDRVVASLPEIGPSPPDGGYGWLVVFSATLYQMTVPTLLSVYGLIILKAIREEDHDEDEKMKIWDVNLALVPVIMIVIRLLLESWCRAVIKIFHMPRFIALAGLCLTVAGVLLSSYSTTMYSNDHIITIFAGIFIGSGCALTGQQTDIIVTHYFREKLTIAQRIVRMAPFFGNCLIPLLIGYLCTIHSGDIVVLIYGAILMQNCLFLAAYTRPVYVERVVRTTYNMIRAVEDDDEVIFSNQNQPNASGRNQERPNPARSQVPSTMSAPNVPTALDDDTTDVVVFKSRRDAKEILDPEVGRRETNKEARFSSDFSSMFDTPENRFSSDFGTLDITGYGRVTGYQELENIDRDAQNPQPLYRATTVNAPQNNSLVFATEVTPGTARRTASLKKNFITVVNMLMDLNFYLYTMLHLCTTYSIFVLGVVFPGLLWEQNASLNIWSVSTTLAMANVCAMCFIALCVALPKTLNNQARLCAAFCVFGAVGFYGITLSKSSNFLMVWCVFASFAAGASSVLQQPIYNSTLNEFDTTATMTTANAFVATALMVWSLAYNYEYKTCFFIASLLQTATACVFFVASFRRRR